MKIMGKIIELYLTLGRVFLKLFGYKMGVILKRHKIDLKAIKPDKHKDTDRYFDESHYIDTNVYVENYANPVKINDQGEELELIASDRYKKFFKMDILESIARLSEGALEVKGWKLIAILDAVTFGVILMMLFLVIGV